MSCSLAMKGDRLQISGLRCACGAAHHAPTQDFLIGTGMARKLPRILKKRELGRKAVMILDRADSGGIGREALEALRAAGFEVSLVEVEGPLADERALGEVILTMRMDTELFLGVGADAVQDLACAAAAQTERPCALMITRPSGWGCLSQEAHLSLRGEPLTLSAVSPEVVAFDLDALTQAPPEAWAQGLAELAACHLARCDWAALKLLRGDAYCPLCADLAVEAAERAFSETDVLVARGEAGARRLAESLVMAGVAAFVSGGARPVSSEAQRLARRAALGGMPYARALPGAVTGLLDAYRAFDPERAACQGGDPDAKRALETRCAGLRQVTGRLPEGAKIAAAMNAIAPAPQGAGLPAAPLCPADAGRCQGLAGFAALAGCPVI